MNGIKILLVFCLTGLLIMGGSWVNSADAAAKKRYMIQSGTMGGSAYLWASIASRMLTKYIPEASFTARTGHGSFSGIPLLERGDVPFLVTLEEGVEEYGSEVLKRRVRSLVSSVINFQHIVANKYLNAKSIYDLKGKKLNVGIVGGSPLLLTTNMFRALGIKFEEFKIFNLGVMDGTPAMKSNQIDAQILQGGIPQPTLVELFVTGRGVDLISLSQEDIKKVEKQFPYYFGFKIPKGAYKGQASDVFTVTSTSKLFCRDDFPEELAYQMTKVLTERHDEMVKAWRGCEGSTAEHLVKHHQYPLHPGAERYYREAGYLK